MIRGDNKPGNKWGGVTAATHSTVTVAHFVFAVIDLVSNALAEAAASNHANLIGDLDMKEPPVRLQPHPYLSNGLETTFADERMLCNDVAIAKVSLK